MIDQKAAALYSMDSGPFYTLTVSVLSVAHRCLNRSSHTFWVGFGFRGESGRMDKWDFPEDGEA